MQAFDLVSPALILGVGGFLYKALRDLRADLRADMRDMRSDIRDLGKRLDNNLEGHTPKP